MAKDTINNSVSTSLEVSNFQREKKSCSQVIYRNLFNTKYKTIFFMSSNGIFNYGIRKPKNKTHESLLYQYRYEDKHKLQKMLFAIK